MQQLFFRIKAYLLYRWHAQNAHDLHSPFVYTLYTQLIRRSNRSLSRKLTKIRKELYNDKQIVTFVDPRTGEKIAEPFGKRARRISSTHKFSLFLARLIDHQGYSRVLETGTGAGATLAYLSYTSAQRVLSLEGSDVLATHVEHLLHQLSPGNYEIIRGQVQDTFIPTLQSLAPEAIFLDADHRSETIRFYLKAIEEHAPSTKCIIIHDIYWSEDMANVWSEIVQNPVYKLTIDLFQAGMVFPHHPMRKQHFCLKF
ncbi:class I SAM-dependent methyltransferase [Marinoscillum furvescens]|uniref:Uncharacterized protein n=1 Tax=Marinoscillum furvescens DSM 4134 TaxID=1122208 RepID=A0A3D9KZW3_MARFU|nr:class I SAM-dependent methyltransferase [Marinoscillum furvescens]RED96198.1 hypothetical protein C7460_11589 [Marinoscillum furvescens DSM 4134]